MNRSLKRNEISEEYKWKLEDLYENDELWQADYDSLSEITLQQCEYKGIVGENVNNLAAVINELDKSSLRLERIYVYSFMRYYEDTANAVYQEMSGKAKLLMTKHNEKYSFLTPEIMSIPQSVMEQYLESDIIAPYVHYLEDMLAKREHLLSEKEERLLAMAGQMAGSSKEIFSKFNNADADFGCICDENGDKVQLTNGRYGRFMESNDRNVRKGAFKSMYKVYGDYINTLAAVYYGNVNQAVFYANARNYESTLEMYLSDLFIPTEVYTNLISVVNNNLDKMYRYVTLRKKALGVSELHFYDIYAPMVGDYELEIPYAEAKKIVLEALKPLGEDYTAKINEGLENGWVDVYENEGKRSGAFSWGAYGTHPYVFLNYSDTLNDVFTLAHELGHAMHTYYSNKTQPHIQADYEIFVAEVASTVNEVILINYLLADSSDEKRKRYLINHFLEQFKGTLFRQTMFAEFELEAHKMAESGEVLSADKLCTMYKELNNKYFGSDMFIDDEIAYEWARIPHFYTPFYVYQYATGFSAAIAIADKILAGDETVLAGYKKFLSGGGSMHPIELLKLCGVDMSGTQAVQEALNVFGKLLDMWEDKD